MDLDPALECRATLLARRARWLDRRRRWMSIACAFVFFIVVSRELSAIFEAPWPNFLLGCATFLFAVAAWWIVEVGFAWLVALWETEHDLLLRDRGLPRARVLLRK